LVEHGEATFGRGTVNDGAGADAESAERGIFGRELRRARGRREGSGRSVEARIPRWRREEIGGGGRRRGGRGDRDGLWWLEGRGGAGDGERGGERCGEGRGGHGGTVPGSVVGVVTADGGEYAILVA